MFFFNHDSPILRFIKNLPLKNDILHLLSGKFLRLQGIQLPDYHSFHQKQAIWVVIKSFVRIFSLKFTTQNKRLPIFSGKFQALRL